mgnify:CR=1 FL=1
MKIFTIACFCIFSTIVCKAIEKDSREIKYAAVLAAATRQSAYSAQETLREGYLTLEGGHRVGVCGTLVLRGGEPYSMKDVTSLNIRVAHDIRMDSARLLPYLRENLLIIGVPGSGKTTLHPDAQSDGTMCQRGG